MKKWCVLCGIVAVAVGCNTASQKFSTVTTAPDGTKTERTTQGKIWNVIQAKQSVADFHGQNGEVQVFGTGSASQEAQGVEMVKEVRGMATDLLGLYMGKQPVGTSAAGTVAAITQVLSALPTTGGFDTNGNLRVNIPGVEWYMLVASNRTLQICYPDGRCYGILPTPK